MKTTLSTTLASVCKNSWALFGIYLLALLTLAVNSAFAAESGEKYGEVCSNVIGLMQGDFGAMLTAAAGVGAIVASAMGGFKMAWALIVVSVGSFILEGYVGLFFDGCGGGGGGA